jgi:hypothetical protein
MRKRPYVGQLTVLVAGLISYTLGMATSLGWLPRRFHRHL